MLDFTDNLKEIGKKAGNFFNETEDNEYILISFIIVIAIVLLVSSWFLTSITQNQRDCKNYNNSLDKLSKYTTNINDIYDANGKINVVNKQKFDDVYKNALKHYYIKTAYNCCCAYGYKNVFVDICALKNALKQGARCLDFEIYSIGLQPVVAVSSVKNYTIKESYNYILLKDVLKVLRQTRDQSDDNNITTTDPIFLHFRIKSAIPSLYDKIYDILYDTRDPTYSIKDYLIVDPTYNYFIGKNSEQQSWPNISLSLKDTNGFKLYQKFIIMIHTIEETKLIGSNLRELTNIYTGPSSKSCELHYFNDINNKGSNDVLTMDGTKTKLYIVLPDQDSNIDNNNWQETIQVLGCQFIGMKFQTSDFNLISYLDYFKSKGNNFSFVHKPSELRLDRNKISMQATPTNILPVKPWPSSSGGGKIIIINEGTTQISLTDLGASMAPGNVNDFKLQKTGTFVSLPANDQKSFNIKTLEAATQFQFKTDQDDDIDISDTINCSIGFPKFTILPRDNAWRDSKITIKLRVVTS